MLRNVIYLGGEMDRSDIKDWYCSVENIRITVVQFQDVMKEAHSIHAIEALALPSAEHAEGFAVQDTVRFRTVQQRTRSVVKTPPTC